MPRSSRLAEVTQGQALVCSADGQFRCVLPLDVGGLHSAAAGAKRPVWVDVPSTEAAPLRALQDVFGLHPLAVEDCIHVGHRAAFDEYPQHLFFLMVTLRPDAPTNLEQIGELEVFLGPDFVLTIHDGPVAALDALRQGAGHEPSPLARGVDGLMHTVVDQAVDVYFAAVASLEDDLDDLQDRVFDPEDRGILGALSALKKQLAGLRRHAMPLQDAVRRLAAGSHPLVQPETALHFRDVYDHVLRINERLETCRELVAGSFDSHYSSISTRANDIMKVLSVVATVTLPMMFLTSFLGMNLEHMSRYLQGPGAFWGVIAAMGMMTVGTLLWLKRRKWM